MALDHVGIFADGVAVREVGELTFAIVAETVDEIVRVTNDEICAAIKDVFDDTRSIMEPAGALAVAGLRSWVRAHGHARRTPGRRAERREHELRSAAASSPSAPRSAKRARRCWRVTIPERAGAFREFCATIGRRVVTEFNYRLSGRAEAHIFVGIATAVARGRRRHRRGRSVAAATRRVDLTDNELAKLHVRHMVGGRSAEVRARTVCTASSFPNGPAR